MIPDARSCRSAKHDELKNFPILHDYTPNFRKRLHPLPQRCHSIPFTCSDYDVIVFPIFPIPQMPHDELAAKFAHSGRNIESLQNHDNWELESCRSLQREVLRFVINYRRWAELYTSHKLHTFWPNNFKHDFSFYLFWHFGLSCLIVLVLHQKLKTFM